jgi:hypothetical protein
MGMRLQDAQNLAPLISSQNLREVRPFILLKCDVR